MSFISRKRVFSKPLSLTQWPVYFFDLLFLGSFWVVLLVAPPLSDFGRESVVALSPRTLTLFGGLGIGFIRLATYVAIIRRNRFPQRLEWILMLLGVGWMFSFILFGGLLLNLWASIHNYRDCPAQSVQNEDAVFAREGTSCPPPGTLRRPI